MVRLATIIAVLLWGAWAEGALVAHWKLDDADASTTVIATVGTNGTAGVNTNTMDASGPGGLIIGAFDIANTSARAVTISVTGRTAGQAYSVSGWSNGDVTNAIIVGTGSGSVAHTYYIASSTTVAVKGTSTTRTFTVPAMDTSTWYNVVVTFDASDNCRVFVNGTESSTGAQTLAESFIPTRIGWSNVVHGSLLSYIKMFDSDESANVAALYAEKDTVSSNSNFFQLFMQRRKQYYQHFVLAP